MWLVDISVFTCHTVYVPGAPINAKNFTLNCFTENCLLVNFWRAVSTPLFMAFFGTSSVWGTFLNSLDYYPADDPVTDDRFLNFSELRRIFNFRVEDVIIHHGLEMSNVWIITHALRLSPCSLARAWMDATDDAYYLAKIFYRFYEIWKDFRGSNYRTLNLHRVEKLIINWKYRRQQLWPENLFKSFGKF